MEQFSSSTLQEQPQPIQSKGPQVKTLFALRKNGVKKNLQAKSPVEGSLPLPVTQAEKMVIQENIQETVSVKNSSILRSKNKFKAMLAAAIIGVGAAGLSDKAEAGGNWQFNVGGRFADQNGNSVSINVGFGNGANMNMNGMPQLPGVALNTPQAQQIISNAGLRAQGNIIVGPNGGETISFDGGTRAVTVIPESSRTVILYVAYVLPGNPSVFTQRVRVGVDNNGRSFKQVI